MKRSWSIYNSGSGFSNANTGPGVQHNNNAAGPQYNNCNFHGSPCSVTDQEREKQEKDQQCLKHLRLTDPRDDKVRIERTKGGLLQDSYRWVLNNADFQQWRDDLQHRLLWIKGDPGKGKTMLLCGIINELDQGDTANARHCNVAYFFCQATDSRINNGTAVLRGLIYLLIDQQPSILSHVQSEYNRAGEDLFKDVNTWDALSRIFTNILRDPSFRTTYLVIDALDECVTIDLPQLLDLIAQ
ncbi:vegetative incompatibility protein HET-E-1 [Pseudoneurospora amorphoporcata]|uniref:Vegetative incompatibility protein HET-E-1 n=1 Tax=Pseudoneurospora amorphoporcata TaxID=241081 RepID=A0AAN6NK23_9PEZI|nr:vegetative incompatibility protein HET-E-1 [Pseudoneurospora amorphoporcata]